MPNRTFIKQKAQVTLAMLALATFNSQLLTADAQGTAFTYQGQLQNSGALANGTFNLTFTLFNVSTGGSPVAGPVTNSAVPVTDGLFTLVVDFGGGVFTGTNYWLQIGVETNGGSSFVTLAPRQPINPTPYAIYAEGVAASGISGTVGDAQLTHSAVTVNAGPGLSGGGTVALGNAITLTNTGVLDTGTSADTPSTLVKRDGSGNFSAATITLDNNLNLPSTSATAGIIYSGGTRLIHAYGSQNFFSGPGAGNLTMFSTGNTANGYQALSSNNGGYDNTAIGAYALLFNTFGNDNTAIGFETLYANTSGSANTAVGYEALNANTSGVQNSAVGLSALSLNTVGADNTANGYAALEFNTTGSYNTANGAVALQSNNGSYNTANGASALQSNNGSYNTANGYQALYSNTSGSNNTALGYQAGYAITTGSYNIDIGNPGLATDTNVIRIGSGQTATFIAGVINGNGSGLSNLSAAQFTGTVSNSQLANSSITINTGAGLTGGGVAVLGGSVTLGSTATSADLANTIVSRDGSGSFSTASISLDGNLNLPVATATAGMINSGGLTLINTFGSQNFFAGKAAGNLTTSGARNTANGYTALLSNTSGSDNTGSGAFALLLNTSGAANTAIGSQALYSNTNGADNTAIGYQALYSNIGDNLGDGADNTASGYQALYSNTFGYGNTANGFQALYSNTGDNSGDGTGAYNTATGDSALYSNTSGSYNTANGLVALYSNTSGHDNTANGVYSLAYNLVGNYNTANGARALWANTNGSFDTAIGSHALYLNTSGSNNTASGVGALYANTTGNYNTADGVQALDANTSGDDNTAVGYQTLYGNTNGLGNTAVGTQALYSNTGNGGGTAGNFNTAVGMLALIYNTVGNNNIALGAGAGRSITTGSANIDIYDSGAAGDDGVIRIGTEGTQTSTYIAGISGTGVSGSPVTVSASGQLGVAPSSKRFKQDIQSMDDASSVLLSLRPVTFKYKPDIDPKGTPQFGLVAEEVATIDPDLVARDSEGRIFTVRYEAVNAMLLNEFLKEHRTVQAQEKKLATQDSEIQQLQQSVAALQAQVSKLVQAKSQLALTK